MTTEQFNMVAGLLSTAIFFVALLAVILPTKNRIINLCAMFIMGYFSYAYLGGQILGFWKFESDMVRVVGLLAMLLIGVYVGRDLALSAFRRRGEG